MQTEFPTIHHIWTVPPEDGIVVGITRWRDDVFIATEYGGVYQLRDIDGQVEVVSLSIHGQQRLFGVSVD